MAAGPEAADEGRDTIIKAAARHRIAMSEQQADALAAYRALIVQFSMRHNLVSTGDLPRLLRRHILNCCALCRHLPSTARRAVDIGSGAGFPGMVLAIMYPNCEFYLTEPNHKKSIFLRQSALSLGLDNVSVIADRIETFTPPHPPDYYTARAVAPMAKILDMIRHCFVAPQRLYCMKARAAGDEGGGQPMRSDAQGWIRTLARHTLYPQGASREVVVIESEKHP